MMSDRGKNTWKRIGSAAALLPLYAFCLVTDLGMSVPVLAASTIITLATLYEFYQITERSESEKAFVPFGLAMGAMINVLMYLYAYGDLLRLGRSFAGFDMRLLIGGITIFLSLMLFVQLYRKRIRGTAYSLGMTFLGIIMVVIPFSHVILMKALPHGWYYIVIMNVVVMINDSAAYFGGVFLGKHKANIPASPNKSWEGYFTGLLFSIISIIVANEFFGVFFSVKLFSMIESVVLGIVISLFGNIGDLSESLIKRDYNIKDSGTIIPGHGGMWDVFDAMIFVTPIFYYFLICTGVR